MQVQGNVISISLETDVKKQAGGTYKGWELVYKSLDNEVRTIAKPVQGLRFNAALKNQLAELKNGDDFTLVQEKNESGFYDVKSVTKGHSMVDPTPASTVSLSAGQQSKPANSGSPGNSYASRDFESKEERIVKQRLIVRQSSVAQAVQILSVGAKTVSLADVKKMAEELTDFVYEKKSGSEALEEMESDEPI